MVNVDSWFLFYNWWEGLGMRQVWGRGAWVYPTLGLFLPANPLA